MSMERKVDGPSIDANTPEETQWNISRLPVLDSAQLFAASHEVWIEHNGEIYRLQRTKAGKLILTK